MFKLLSKESNIFSIPIYIIFILLMVSVTNILNFSAIGSLVTFLAFCGIALGYFVFNQINLTYQIHAPLFLYSAFIFALYPHNLDIGIAITLLTNSFLLLILTAPEEEGKRGGYVLVGSILMCNYLFLPTTWPMFFFVVLHIIATSRNIILSIFRLLLGIFMIFTSYLCVMFYFGFTAFNEAYLPIDIGPFVNDFYPLYYLLPVVCLAFYSTIDHFTHYNEKSPTSRFKYTFLLVFTLAQLITVVLYMGRHYDYLLLLAFPFSIILSRMLYFFPKYWVKELGLWIIIISLLVFKANQYIQF